MRRGWLTAAIWISLLALGFALGLQKIRTFDYWWQLRTGALILETGEVPKHDVYTDTVPGAGYIDNIVCPINGSAYADTWGAPRSGGRRHQGVDMIAPEGVPLFAVVSGVVTFKQNRLGGNAVSLAGDNGNRYYYAHLSAYEGEPRWVEQGEVIGYVGDTGNATGIPHLHFEIRRHMPDQPGPGYWPSDPVAGSPRMAERSASCTPSSSSALLVSFQTLA